MFSIVVPEGEPSYSSARYLMDTERDVSVRFTRSAGPDPILEFMMEYKGIRFPFSIFINTGDIDPVSGHKYVRYTFEHFGPGYQVDVGNKTATIDTTGKYDLEKFHRIAAEAVLIYGTHYNGLTLDPEYIRVERDGKLLTRRDFGYLD